MGKTPTARTPQYPGQASRRAANSGHQTKARRKGRVGIGSYILPVGAVLVLSVAVIAAALTSAPPPAGTEPGRIAAATTNYDFGRVPFGGGLISTRFELAVESDARVVGLSTT